MRLVVFGLSVTSAWGNGHATLWRGLLRALGSLGHRAVFFEKDTPFYAAHRDLERGDGYDIVVYPTWEAVLPRAAREVAAADVAIVTSYQADARAACDLVLASRARRVFYDLDTPVTLERLTAGEPVDYVPAEGLAAFDLVLSYTGGAALDGLRRRLKARRVEPLYGSVDPAAHRPAEALPAYACDLSYLGTYASDRQPAVDRLFLQVAAGLPARRFVLGGPMYPPAMKRSANVALYPHVAPGEHPAFYGSSRLTLNLTRAAMASCGFCPSARLFEAAACGAVVLSDPWQGLERFFERDREILVADTPDDVVRALHLPDGTLRRVARRARARVLAEHTARHRALELVRLLS